MSELFKDTVVGHLVRWLSQGKILPHAEDRDPSIWRMYVSTEKSKKLSGSGAFDQPQTSEKQPAQASSQQWASQTEASPTAEETDKPTKRATFETEREKKQAERNTDEITPVEPSTGNQTEPAGSVGQGEAQPTQTHSEPQHQQWSSANTPKTGSNVNTPYNGSSTALIRTGETHAGPEPAEEKPEQEWVTAAMGQEGMHVSMEQGHVDGDPALEWHAEGSEAAWNAVKLEAGHVDEEPTKAEPVPTVEPVHNVVVWFGPTDPENPRNWTHKKRAFVTAQIYLLTLCTYIGTSIFSPGSSNVENHFGVSSVAATLGTSLAILGYGLGVMIWSPMSEAIRIGRKPVYIVTLLVFVALQAGTALARNFGMLLAFRFLSGIFGAPVLAMGGASITDMYSPTERGYAIVIWDVVSIATPVLGPLIGGFAAQANGWRWTIWTLMWLSGGTLVLLLFLMPETNPLNILYRRSRRLRVLTGNKSLRSEADVLGGELRLADNVERFVTRPFVLAFTEPILLVINIYIALLNAILFTSLDSFPLVFQDIYDFNLGQTGLAFFGLFVGSVLAAPPMFYYLRYRLEPQVNALGEVKPEKRLPPAIVGAFLVPISLLVFGWTARRSIHWIVPIMGSSLFGVAYVTLAYASLNYLPDTYPSYAATVLAGNELFRSTASAVFPLFATAMYNKLGIGPASSLLAGISCLFISVPFMLYYYGHIIRGRSKRAKQEF